jgi:hypothetical protein
MRVVEAMGAAHPDAGADSLARLAAELGYFDQAHFRRALGRPPARHARAAT